MVKGVPGDSGPWGVGDGSGVPEGETISVRLGVFSGETVFAGGRRIGPDGRTVAVVVPALEQPARIRLTKIRLLPPKGNHVRIAFRPFAGSRHLLTG
jgi:hypothetical protein